ncbi:MAG: DUF1761 domain-containing protein [Patescibacteria group bacterium]
MFDVNILAVLIAAVVAFIIGFLMHGPVAGKLWMRLANIHPTGNEKLSDMYGKMFSNLVVNIITAYALAVVWNLMMSSSYTMLNSALCNGIYSALLVWIGFLATSSYIEVVWMGRSCKLWMFEAFSSGIVMVAMGIVISLW